MLPHSFSFFFLELQLVILPLHTFISQHLLFLLLFFGVRQLLHRACGFVQPGGVRILRENISITGQVRTNRTRYMCALVMILFIFMQTCLFSKL